MIWLPSQQKTIIACCCVSKIQNVSTLKRKICDVNFTENWFEKNPLQMNKNCCLVSFFFL